MRRAIFGSLVVVAALAAACGGSSSAGGGSTTTTGGTTSTTAATSTTASGNGLNEAKFHATNACTTLPTAQMVALVGGPLSGAPESRPGPGPIGCVFAASVNGESSPGSIQIEYFGKGGPSTTPKNYIDGDEQGYHPQPEPGLGDYAVFDPSLRQTSAAKGPIVVTVAGNPPGAQISQVETAQANAANAIFESLGV